MSRLVKGIFLIGSVFIIDVTWVNFFNNKIIVEYQDNPENRKIVSEIWDINKGKYT